jgi:hypothetical protein
MRLVTIAFMVSMPALAQAQATMTVEQARAQLANEPSVSETVDEALRYFRVDPDSFDGLRTSARTRALLPLLAGGFRFDDADLARAQEQMITTPFTQEEEANTRVYTFSVGGVWDLRELVFNSAEVQVYGLIGVQRDIMLESIRTYYLRRQLLLRLMLRPPEDPLAYAALEMRVDEFTAILDVLTGRWFSTETTRRRGGR